MATEDGELLALAQQARGCEEARWSFVDHPKITSIVDREVRRLARTEDDRADLSSEARLGIHEAFRDSHEFASEAELVSYWNLRIRGIVEAALRRGGGCVFRDGRVVRMEWPAGSDVLGDRVEEPAHPRLLTGQSGSGARHEGSEATLDSHRRQEREAERRRMLELAREYLFQYGSAEGASCFWYRLQGVPWRELPELVGLPGGSKGRERAAVLYHKFVADARRHLIERGERVTLTVLGLHVDEVSVSAVLLDGRELLERWTGEYEGPRDRAEIVKALRALFRQGVNTIAAAELPDCETGELVREVCIGRELPLEEFEVELLERGLPPSALSGTGITSPGLRRAYLAARAKAIECELKMDRYPCA